MIVSVGALVIVAGVAAWWLLIKPGRDASPQQLGPAPRLIDVAPQIAAASDLSQKVIVKAKLTAELQAEPGSPLAYYSSRPMEINLSATRSDRGAAYQLGIQLTGDPFEALLVSSEKDSYAKVGDQWYKLAGSLIPSDKDLSPLSSVTPESVGGFLTRLGSLGLSAQGSTVEGAGGGSLYQYEIEFSQPRTLAVAIARATIHGGDQEYVEKRRERLVDKLAPLFTHGDIKAVIRVYASSFALQSIELTADIPQRDLAPIFPDVIKPRNEPAPDASPAIEPSTETRAQERAPIDPLRPLADGDGLQRLQLGLYLTFSGWGRDHSLPKPGPRPLSSPRLRSLLYQISPTLLVPSQSTTTTTPTTPPPAP